MCVRRALTWAQAFPFPIPGMGFGGRGGAGGARFETTYKAFPVAFMSRPELESGGKSARPPPLSASCVAPVPRSPAPQSSCLRRPSIG